MFVYTIPTGASSLTTNATPATETDDLFIKAGTGRAVKIRSFLVSGKAAALTAISGILFRLKKWTTASTSGTAVTPVPTDPGAQAAKCTAAFSPTAGSGGGTYSLAFGCGAGGPGGWQAADDQGCIVLESGYAGSQDLYSISGTASLPHDVMAEVAE